MAMSRGQFVRLLNKRLVQFQERFLRNGYVVGYPFHLVLETGNRCNLRCPLCPTPYRESRVPTGRLSLENARRILDQFPYVNHVNLSLWGEPLLNKDIFDIIRCTRSRDIEVLVQSNLNILSEETAERLVDSNLDILQISLDGASQESYEKYRVGGDFASVIRHINLIKDAQQRKGSHKPHIIWKMVVNRFNEHEIPIARNWARELGLEFKLVEIYTPSRVADDWKPTRKIEESDEVHSDIVSRCYSLWQVAMVNFNGDVLPCCSEYSRLDAIGNVFEEPFHKIWNNRRYMDLRRHNRHRLNCEICHKDKDTNWYRSWMS